MPLIDRPVILDRRTLIDPINSDNEGSEHDEEVVMVQQLGDGGGPVVNGVEFEEGDYNVAAASNVAAVLSVAESDGQEFERAFATAAIQLKDLADAGEDISDLVRFGVAKNIAEVGMSDEDIDGLRQQPPLEEDEQSEEASIEEDEEDDDVDLEDVEESIEEVKEEEEDEEE